MSYPNFHLVQCLMTATHNSVCRHRLTQMDTLSFHIMSTHPCLHVHTHAHTHSHTHTHTHKHTHTHTHKHTHTHTFHQFVFTLSEKSLLSSAPPLCDDLQFKWSSYTRASEDRQCHSAILSFSEPMKFWSPSLTDPHPCLEVEFKRNHVVTTIELRGRRCSVIILCIDAPTWAARIM